MASSNLEILELPSIDHPDAWETPVLFDDIAVPDIPSWALPGVLGEFTKALAEATETPEALAVMTVLGVISVALTKRFKVSPKEGWEEPVNIYVFIGLPPANNKSQVLKCCTVPLVEWESEQAKLLELEIKRQKSERKTQEKIIEGLRMKASKIEDSCEQQQLVKIITEKENSLVEPIVLPILFATDATPESLATTAYEQGGRFAVFTDEGGIIETLSGLYSHGMANVDILLKGIDGGEVRVRRKDRSFNICPYLTMVLTVQPAIIQNMGDKRAYTGNGALERFLYVLPSSKLGFRTHNNPAVSPDVLRSYGQKIKELLSIPTLSTNDESAYMLTLNEEANSAWRTFQADIEKDLRPGGRLIACQGWGGKICGFALRIAGLLHVAEYGHQCLIINKATMQNALDMAEILVEHAIAAYGIMGIDQATHDAKEIFNWIKAKGALSFTKSDLSLAMRNKKVGRNERLKRAVELLIDRNLISEPRKLPTRKPTTVYYVNPAAIAEVNTMN